MAWATALHYVEQLSSQLGLEALPHLRRGRSLSREALLAITKGVPPRSREPAAGERFCVGDDGWSLAGRGDLQVHTGFPRVFPR